VNFDLKNREAFFPDLFCSLDLKRISDEVLDKKVKNNPLVKKYDRSQEHVLNAEMDENRGIEVVLFAGNKCKRHPVNGSSCVIGYNLAEKCSYHFANLPFELKESIMTPCLKTNRIYISDDAIKHTKPRSSVVIFQLDLKDGKGTLLKFDYPNDYYLHNIHSILTCAGIMYFIVSCYFVQLDGQFAQKWSTLLVEATAEGRFEIKQCLFEGNRITDVKACVMQDNKICILRKTFGKNQESKGNSASFFVFDIASNRIYDHSKGARWDTLMLPVGDEIIVTSIGEHSCTRYSFATGEWIHNEEQFLSFPTQPFYSTDYRLSSDGNNIYLFGEGIHGVDSSYRNWCYSFTKKRWRKLGWFTRRQRGAFCLIQVPRDIPLCHLQCPHCQIKSRTTPSTRCPTCLQ
jgi:hypothetical protein